MVGGGQAGLAAGYHLRRRGLDFVILDGEAAPGGDAASEERADEDLRDVWTDPCQWDPPGCGAPGGPAHRLRTALRAARPARHPCGRLTPGR
ncbi:NAD(P)-binding protein [Streptomyces sp. NPDC058867]|uniref:NAD(P)-binding protein n=1 Tax=Streptomyces sp. NPDC058867 TaxID=3346657 RepID=UPI0036B45CA7